MGEHGSPPQTYQSFASGATEFTTQMLHCFLYDPLVKEFSLPKSKQPIDSFRVSNTPRIHLVQPCDCLRVKRRTL